MEDSYFGVDPRLVEKARGLEHRLRKISGSGRLSHAANQLIGWLISDFANLSGFNQIVIRERSIHSREVSKYKEAAKNILRRIRNDDFRVIVEFLNKNEKTMII